MMLDLNDLSQQWFEVIWRSTVQGAVFISVVFAIGLLFLKRMTCKTQCWLWRLVFLKLIFLMIVFKPIAIPVLPANEAPKNFCQFLVATESKPTGQHDKIIQNHWDSENWPSFPIKT